MEIRRRFVRRFDPRVVFAAISAILVAVYIAVGIAPVEAADYEISTQLSISAIGLESGVTEMTLTDNNLDVPGTIVGSYTQAKNKTLLVGHSTTVFQGLTGVSLGDEIEYGSGTYKVVKIEKLRKSEISMNEVLAPAEKETLVVMTCAGTLYNDGDASHRLMLTAEKIE